MRWGADHELAGEEVAVDDAGAGDVDQPLAEECLEAVRIGPPEPGRQPEQQGDRSRGQTPHEGPRIVRALHRLRAHHQVGALLEQGRARW